MTAADRFPHVEVADERELYAWLRAHHGQHDAVWLVTFKKAVPGKYIPHDAVLDHLVAFEWIDGIRRRMDDQRSMQLISPRRTQPWAKSYKDRASRLLADGRMHASGLASIEQAKANGMWEAMNDVDALVVPLDLAEALAAAPLADQHFAAFPPSTRRNILRWIASARTSATRAKRIELTAAEPAGTCGSRATAELSQLTVTEPLIAHVARALGRLTDGAQRQGSSSAGSSQPAREMRR